MLSDIDRWWQAYCASVTGLHAFRTDSGGLEPDAVSKIAVESADRAVEDHTKRVEAYSAQADPPWTGHARVELMGHRSYLGRIREIDRYGSRLGEVQVLLASGEYGSIIPFGGKSIYTITPIALEDALKELRPDKSLCCYGCGRRIRKLQWGETEYSDPPCVTCNECKTDCRKCGHYSGTYYGPCKIGIRRARGETCEKFQAAPTPVQDGDDHQVDTDDDDDERTDPEPNTLGTDARGHDSYFEPEP